VMWLRKEKGVSIKLTTEKEGRAQPRCERPGHRMGRM